jgi:hypothetical protein
VADGQALLFPRKVDATRTINRLRHAAFRVFYTVRLNPQGVDGFCNRILRRCMEMIGARSIAAGQICGDPRDIIIVKFRRYRAGRGGYPCAAALCIMVKAGLIGTVMVNRDHQPALIVGKAVAFIMGCFGQHHQIAIIGIAHDRHTRAIMAFQINGGAQAIRVIAEMQAHTFGRVDPVSPASLAPVISQRIAMAIFLRLLRQMPSSPLAKVCVKPFSRNSRLRRGPCSKRAPRIVSPSTQPSGMGVGAGKLMGKPSSSR